jgi:hypothetical protein
MRYVAVHLAILHHHDFQPAGRAYQRFADAIVNFTTNKLDPALEADLDGFVRVGAIALLLGMVDFVGRALKGFHFSSSLVENNNKKRY